MKPVYIFPFVCGILILLFFLCLPNLRRECEVPAPRRSPRKGLEALGVGLITLVYAATAFFNLGNTNAPETYVSFGADVSSVILEADEVHTLGSISFFSGIGVGTYYISTSDDGITWSPLDQFNQDYIAVLKWHSLPSDTGADYTGRTFRYLSISGGGTPDLNEIIVRDADGVIVSLTGCDVLTDESDTEPEDSTFLDSSYFDEIYHARTAYEHIRDIYPYEISHPPLGKLILGLGIRLFGMTPFGWRFSGTFLGVLMLPLIYIFAKKMFRNTFASMCCALLTASDFMHFVHTRIATIDTYAVFFILLMYLFMYLFITEEKKHWLALSGIFFGFGIASKWTCFYAGAGLALIWAAYWVISFRHKRFLSFLRNCLFCLVFFVVIPFCIYYLSYIPYARASGLHGFSALFSREYFLIFWNNQTFMFNYHSGITATHPYSSRWYQWVLNIRPILYYLEYYPDGTRSSFGAFVNPILAWAGLVSLLILVPEALFRKDRDAAFILTGYLAQLVPWIFVTRITFEYHYFPCTVFLVLAMGYIIQWISSAGRFRKAACIALTCLSCLLFVFFYPVLSGLPVSSYTASSCFGWLPSWPF